MITFTTLGFALLFTIAFLIGLALGIYLVMFKIK